MRMNKLKPKTNLFLKPVECWSCLKSKHKLVITKYHGLLCKNCYKELYEETRQLLIDFIASFEIEFDTNLSEYMESLETMTEAIADQYKGSRDFDFKPQYKEIMGIVAKIYETTELKKYKSKKVQKNY